MGRVVKVRFCWLAIAFITAAAATLFVTPCMAQGTPNYNGYQRLCLQEDLVPHVFVRVDFQQTPVRKETALMSHFRYAYLRFMQGNYYNALSTNRMVETAQKMQKMLMTNPGRFTISQDGVLTFIKGDRIRQTFRCIAVLQPYGIYIKGDLILNGYTRKKKSELYELYRLWY